MKPARPSTGASGGLWTGEGVLDRAYHAAVLRGHDVDKPRNLAKSVTVE